VLNQPAYRKAQIIVAGDNFGCGSSREHAPWALLDFGIRCVISTSFADIFYNNCFKNGILPVVLPPEAVAQLMDDAKEGRQRPDHGRPCGADRHRFGRHEVCLRGGSLQEALPVERAGRHRPDAGEGCLDRQLASCHGFAGFPPRYLRDFDSILQHLRPESAMPPLLTLRIGCGDRRKKAQIGQD
jgi:hypothetical protein